MGVSRWLYSTSVLHFYGTVCGRAPRHHRYPRWRSVCSVLHFYGTVYLRPCSSASSLPSLALGLLGSSRSRQQQPRLVASLTAAASLVLMLYSSSDGNDGGSSISQIRPS